MKIAIPVVAIESEQGRKLLKKIKIGRTARNEQVQAAVSAVLADVRQRGDRALFSWTQKFDKVRLTAATVRVSPQELQAAACQVPAAFRKTLTDAARRIKAYHQKQKREGYTLHSAEARLAQLIVPLDRVGVYIPGGHTVYPSTVLMDVIPAQIAGVAEIVAVTPPRQGLDPAIAFVLDMLKVEEVYRVGGSQAVAALAYGTQSIRPVDKIVGPGNAYVATAKRLVYGSVDIDSVAGPSEVAIIADASADPSWVALDLLAQAEHGSGDEVAVCVTDSPQTAQAIRERIYAEIEASPVKAVFERLAPQAITIFVADSRDAAIAFVNNLAPEHLQIMTRTAAQDVRKIRNAAAIFVGSWTPVALGDYFIGTNHVLPTGGAARFASPLGVESFVKRISVAQVLSREGLAKVGPPAARFARAEQFIHHALSVERRLQA